MNEILENARDGDFLIVQATYGRYIIRLGFKLNCDVHATLDSSDKIKKYHHEGGGIVEDWKYYIPESELADHFQQCIDAKALVPFNPFKSVNNAYSIF